MKRILIVAALLIGGVAAAHADRDIFQNTRRQARGDADLQRDTEYCGQSAGPNRNGRPTPAAFKRCMASRGWRYVRTVREATYPDPDDPNQRCKDIVQNGRVIGSHCSNRF
jgi:hypothetical protein